MVKKGLLIALLIFITFFLTGCWDYISLNEITIVTGMAIDYTEDQKGYHLSIEIIDMTKSTKETGIKTAIIESDGTTLFDAVRNAKKRSANKLYFGDTTVIILSEQVAKNEKMQDIVDWYLRNAEHRETLLFVISKEKHAKDILKVKNPTEYVTAFVIKKIVSKDQMVTSSTVNNEAYKIFNILKENKQTLTLPAFHTTINDEELTIEVDGIAVFDKNKLLGFIDNEKAQYVLFALNKVKGGIFTINKDNKNKDDISLEISKSTTKTSYKYENDKFTFTININLYVMLGEKQNIKSDITLKKLDDIKKIAEKKLNDGVKKVIKMVQNDFNSDIFGFSNIIYQKNPKLWKKVSKDWDNVFKKIDIKVKSKVIINNTAFIK